MKKKWFILIRGLEPQAVSDDISYIESQGKGLQVQTSNQQVLLNELRHLLVSVHE